MLDEPVSALDVSVQAQILNLLMDLKRDRGLAYVFISHDLSVVRYVADRIYVMYLGRIVEVADQHSLWTSPRHHYTRALIDAVPKQRAQPRCSEMSDAIGSVSAVTPPSGCRFHPRCRAATDLCLYGGYRCCKRYRRHTRWPVITRFHNCPSKSGASITRREHYIVSVAEIFAVEVDNKVGRAGLRRLTTASDLRLRLGSPRTNRRRLAYQSLRRTNPRAASCCYEDLCFQ